MKKFGQRIDNALESFLCESVKDEPVINEDEFKAGRYLISTPDKNVFHVVIGIAKVQPGEPGERVVLDLRFPDENLDDSMKNEIADALSDGLEGKYGRDVAISMPQLGVDD